MLKRCSILIALLATTLFGFSALAAEDVFAPGRTAYQAGQFSQAGQFFHDQLKRAPSAEAWHDFGNAAWQDTQPGLAVLAWNRALWINPYDTNAAASLLYVGSLGQIPDMALTWNEQFSTWLPANFWAGLAATCLWLAVALVLLPKIFRWRKSMWPQLLAAAALGVFLMTLLALAGIHSRAKIGVVLAANTSLRQTPTLTAQVMSRLAAGELVRYQSIRGEYYFVRTANDELGWLAKGDLRFVAANDLPDWSDKVQPSGAVGIQ